MNETELLLLKTTIEGVVYKAVNEALKPVNEELKKVKALNVKLLKEHADMTKMLSEGAIPAKETLTVAQFKSQPTSNLSEGMYDNLALKTATLNELKAKAAPFAKADGILPDIDIDPGLFLKK